MNILVDSDGLAWVLVKNGDPVSARQDGLFIGNPVHSIFSAGAAEDWAAVSCDEVPNDWQPGRYFLIDDEWSLNADWQEPEVPPTPEPAPPPPPPTKEELLAQLQALQAQIMALE